MDKKDCIGCYQNFYNTKTKECWSFCKSRKKVKRILVHRDQMPPFKAKPKAYPECYSGQQYVLVDPKNLTKEGYWI